MFMPILAQSSAFRRVQQPVGLVESRPQLSSHEPRRPLSPDLADVSDSELEFNRLPLTSTAAVSVVCRQQLIASQASHTSHVSRTCRRMQESRHSNHSSVASIVEAFQLAHKLTDELTTVLKAQRIEAAECERLAAERGRTLRTDALEREKLQLQQTADREALQLQQAANREQALRLEALEREKLALQREQMQQQEAARLSRESIEREKFIIQMVDRERDRAAADRTQATELLHCTYERGFLPVHSYMYTLSRRYKIAFI